MRHRFNLLSRIVRLFLKKFANERYNYLMEFRYWKMRQRSEGTLANRHYEYFFTTFFGLTRADYAGKRILDIGCGPRGSLEWISSDADCFGLDPLSAKYRSLGIDAHKMRYVQGTAERIPFPDGHFQIVTSFNNLDHVQDVGKAIAEIKRVTAPGGTFLLITQVEHKPIATEPQNLPMTIASEFGPEFEIVSQGIGDVRDEDLYQSLREGNPIVPGRKAAVYARFVKAATGHMSENSDSLE